MHSVAFGQRHNKLASRFRTSICSCDPAAPDSSCMGAGPAARRGRWQRPARARQEAHLPFLSIFFRFARPRSTCWPTKSASAWTTLAATSSAWHVSVLPPTFHSSGNRDVVVFLLLLCGNQIPVRHGRTGCSRLAWCAASSRCSWRPLWTCSRHRCRCGGTPTPLCAPPPDCPPRPLPPDLDCQVGARWRESTERDGKGNLAGRTPPPTRARRCSWGAAGATPACCTLGAPAPRAASPRRRAARAVAACARAGVRVPQLCACACACAQARDLRAARLCRAVPGRVRPFRHARWAVVIRMTLPATGQLVWQCGDRTVELESAS